jgi:hypothetical protein
MADGSATLGNVAAQRFISWDGQNGILKGRFDEVIATNLYWDSAGEHEAITMPGDLIEYMPAGSNLVFQPEMTWLEVGTLDVVVPAGKTYLVTLTFSAVASNYGGHTKPAKSKFRARNKSASTTLYTQTSYVHDASMLYVSEEISLTEGTYTFSIEGAGDTYTVFVNDYRQAAFENTCYISAVIVEG